MTINLQTWLRVTALAVLVFAPAAATRADVVADWNAVAVQATITAGASGPAGHPTPTGVIDIAMVHAAVHDAVQAIERRYEPYYVEVKGAYGSPIAAAAKAARDVLANRFPAQAATFDAVYQEQMAAHGLSEGDPGIWVGVKAAAGIIALRACDGGFPDPAAPPFTGGGTTPGIWSPTPPNFAPMVAPWLGDVTPFTLTRPSQFLAAPPPALNSRRYARDYHEVKAVGALNDSTRTPEQTDLAHFYAGNTLVIWNRALRDIAVAHVDNIGDSARLFALADMAIADALIASWNSKNYYVFWRPITAIRAGDDDGNSWTAGDPNWQSLINAPAYPDHTSGANAFASAALRSLRHFFGTDRMAFSVTTTNAGPTQQDTRAYRRFSDAAQDVVDARVYSGIHFRFADEAARKQGRQVADWVFGNFLRPLGAEGDDGDRDDEGHDGRQ